MKFSIEIKEDKFHYSYEVYHSKQSGECFMNLDLYMLFSRCLDALNKAQLRSLEERRLKIMEQELTGNLKESK